MHIPVQSDCLWVTQDAANLLSTVSELMEAYQELITMLKAIV